MDAFGKAHLHELLDQSPQTGASLYMPTHRAGRETQQNRIRLKNLLAKAEDQLLAQSATPAAVDGMLLPARQLLADEQFWQFQSDGLAVFLAPGFQRRYRLPLKFPERCVVGPRFYIKPLLPMLTEEGHFYLLALSLKQARLMTGTRDSMDELEVPAMPAGVAQAARGSGERSLQFHSSSAGGGAIFHGHGSDEEESAEELKRYFREVDRAVMGRLPEEHAPLVLAAVESHLPLYRELSDYANVLRGGVAGNPDDLSPLDLHARAWSLVRPHFARDMLAAEEKFNSWLGTGSASSQIEVVLPAAYSGRVDFLFVPTDVQQWGSFNTSTLQVALHEGQQDGSQDLLDLACEYTLKHGGAVYALRPERMPQGGMVAAGFRF